MNKRGAKVYFFQVIIVGNRFKSRAKVSDTHWWVDHFSTGSRLLTTKGRSEKGKNKGVGKSKYVSRPGENQNGFLRGRETDIPKQTPKFFKNEFPLFKHIPRF